MTNTCGHPKEMIPDPPGATDPQKYCNLYHYTLYLRRLLELPEDDCKGQDDAWNQYSLSHGTICYPET